MTTTLERSYQPLASYDVEGPDETPHEIHVVPEGSKSRWNHVEDLDSFFSRMYRYHQKHGFYCMMLQEFFGLLQFGFVVIFTTYLRHCVDYPILFRDKVLANKTKVALSDAILPLNECTDQISGLTWICLFVAFVFWALSAVRSILHLVQFWEVKNFYESALKISDSELDNLTWHEVQRRVRDVQREQQMCIHKQDLSELDIYHRILRFKNYMIAMVNKSLLPVKLQVPFVGEVIFMTRGLKYNLELLLFSSPWAPFENSWHLKEDYKKVAKRKELADELSRCILWVGLANLVFFPVVLLWQILYLFFNYAELIKREPGSLGSRSWSLYGKLYLRHFNELDHELHARLNRAYRPAAKYMDSFTSPLLTIIAENVGFVAGAVGAVLFILTVYDEDVIAVEHVLLLMTSCSVVYVVCRASIPDQNMVWCPEKLMTAILAHVHYLPEHWKGHAHTQGVRQELAQLFQLKAVALLEELLSPLLTPYVLCFHVRHKALDIVDFYRNFTVEVVGVGDVCSFAQMDVRKHGNTTWQTSVHSGDGAPPTDANQYTQAEDGKTELSLVHFTLTNPEWRPPMEAETFVMALRNHAIRDAATGTGGGQIHNPLLASINSVSSLGTGYSSVLSSVLHHPSQLFRSEIGPSVSVQQLTPDKPPTVRGGINRAEGPLVGSDRGLLYSLTQCGPTLGNSMFGSETPVVPEEHPAEFAAADMSLSTLYMHELHHRQMKRRVGGFLDSSNRSLWQRPHQDMPGISETPEEQRAEKTPLLRPRTNPFTDDS